MSTTTTQAFDTVAVGDELPPVTYTVGRANLVMYAGASGDFNVIHWNQRVAQSVGLPDVIAHGMYTMALGGRFVSEWAGDAGAVLEYGVRFTQPVVVPDDGVGAVIEVSGKVGALLGDNKARVDLVVTSDGHRVLTKPFAVVRLP